MPKKIILILAGLVLVSAGCAKVPVDSSEKTPPDYNHRLLIAGKLLNVEIADTDEKKAQGLSGRRAMQPNQGMLFDFRNTAASRPAFWMKNMKFALDFIWIKNFRVIGITPNAPPPKSPGEKLKLYSPPADIDMVLEANASWTEQHGVKVGDEIRIIPLR